MTCVTCVPCGDVRPVLGLEEFRRVLKYNPYYFWQMGQNPADVRQTAIPYDGSVPCEQVIFEAGEYGGHGAGGRADVGRAIKQVTQAYVDYAGFFPRLTYSSEELVCARPWSGRGRLQLSKKKVQALGVETLEKVADITIDPTTDIVDVNNDGLLDTVNLTNQALAGTISDGDELLLFRAYDEDECVLTGEMEAETFWKREIRPAKVSLNDAGTLDVIFRSWLAVEPLFYGGANMCVLDPQDVSIYAQNFEVWRRYTDATNVVQLWRRNRADCTCSCVEANTTIDDTECYTYSDEKACLVNGEQGIIELNLGNWRCCWRCIDKLCVHTLSGECNDVILLARAVAGELGRQLCCGKTHTELAYWQTQYVGQTTDGNFSSAVSRAERRSGLGTSRGALKLYEYLRPRRSLRVVRV